MKKKKVIGWSGGPPDHPTTSGLWLLGGELPDIVGVGGVVGRLLDHAELQRGLGAALEQVGLHVADLGALVDRVTPDQLVDLVHLPLLGVLLHHAAGVVL